MIFAFIGTSFLLLLTGVVEPFDVEPLDPVEPEAVPLILILVNSQHITFQAVCCAD